MEPVAKSKIKKVIAVYPGRFQPMGKHHAQTFKWVQDKFGVNNSFVVTSDKTEEKSPFTFNEKKQIISAHGIKNVVKVKNPYKPDEVTKKFDPETTALVLVVGKKDLERLKLGKFLHEYDGQPTLGLNDGAYVLIAPHISLKVPGYGEMSGTAIRAAFKAPMTEAECKELFKNIFGFYNDKIYKLVVGKLGRKVNETKYTFEDILRVKQQVLMEAPGAAPTKKTEAEKTLLQKIKYKDANGKDRESTVGSILRYGDKHPAYKKAQTIYDKAKGEKKQGTEPAKKEEPPTKLSATDLQTPQEKQAAAQADKSPEAEKKKDADKFKSDFDTDGDGKVSAKEVLHGIKKSIEKWSEKEKQFFKDGDHKPGSKVRTGVGDWIKRKAKGIVKGVKRELEHQGHAWKDGVKGLASLAQGKKPDHHEMEGLKHIGKTVALTIGVGIATGGVGSFISHGAAGFMKHLAIHTAEHVAADIAALGVGKAALFADINAEDEDRLMTDFVNKIADAIANGKIPPQVLAKAIDSYNKEKEAKGEDASDVDDIGDLDIEERVFSKDWWGTIIKEMESELDSIPPVPIKKKVKEDITIPINVGDVVLGGKFKNKKITVKTIGKNDKGEITINGKPLLRYRILQKEGLLDHAKAELERANLFSEESDYNGMIGKAVYALIEKFAEQGHSGFSAAWVRELFTKLSNYETLTPLTESPDEWMDTSDYGTDSAGKLWQNRRNPAVFSKDGGKTMYHVDGKTIVNGIVEYIKETRKGTLNEGGAYGHMSHPFDDKELTFGDIKQMIDMGLQGTLDIEQSVSEKTDGQNLMVTWKGGKLRAARNKTQIKDPIDAKTLKSMFAGRGNIEKAFVYAMTDLEKAISSLSDKQREKVFGNGNTFMNLEIIYPATENVINYDAAVLQFHGTITYDNQGNPVASNKESARMLQGMITQVNADVQDHFKIIKPKVLTINPHQDYSAKRKYFLDKLKKLQSKFALSDNDTLALYHQKWWETHITAQAKKFKYAMPNTILMALVNRWAFGDKSMSIVNLKKQINNDKFNDWMTEFDKTKVADMVKQNMLPFELLIFELGSEILKNVEGFLTANPDKAIQVIKDKVAKAIKDVQSGGDIKKLNTLKAQLAKIDAIGGFNAIVPSEGLVFIYKGKTYKITGAFGPVNQVIGLMTF